MPSRKIGTYGAPWKIRRSRRKLKMPGYKRVWGWCDYEKREIVLDPRIEGHPIERDTVVHEVLHKICPFLSEECVTEMATELDDVLDLLEL